MDLAASPLARMSCRALAVTGSTTLVGVVYRSNGRSVAEAMVHRR
jgi:hypothetical protein